MSLAADHKTDRVNTQPTMGDTTQTSLPRLETPKSEPGEKSAKPSARFPQAAMVASRIQWSNPELMVLEGELPMGPNSTVFKVVMPSYIRHICRDAIYAKHS